MHSSNPISDSCSRQQDSQATTSLYSISITSPIATTEKCSQWRPRFLIVPLVGPVGAPKLILIPCNVMSQLKIYLLGSPRVEVKGKNVELARRKVLALLAYLAVTRQPQRRDGLVGLLWPESGQKAARASLRRELHALTQVIGDEWLITTRDTIELNSEADVWIDVEEFRQLIAQGGDGSNEPVAQLNNAVELYQNDFLAGFSLVDCPEFDDWQFFQTDELRRLFGSALETLISYYESQGAFEAATGCARRWLALDAMHEPAHRKLMTLFALAGQQAAAVRQYDECVRILDTELGVSPEDETAELFEAIRTRRYPQETKGAGQEQQPSTASQLLDPQLPNSGPEPPKLNLPTQPTTFIGRKDELAAIRQLLTNEDDCRLLSLIGPGGIGKTRLAVEAALELIDIFPDGIYFVGLAAVSAHEHIIPTIAATLNFSFEGDGELEMQLIDHLHTQKLLLVVDNLEHLLGGAALLSTLVTETTAVKLLVTSREVLGLEEEWFYAVGGMSIPTDTDSWADVQNNGSVQLFTMRARRANTTFALAEMDKQSMVELCQLVGGIPLGLELAAGWTSMLSVAEIGNEIRENLAFLATTTRNVPERQQSMRAIFDASWQRLTDAEQTSFRQLSVFHGTFTRAAAQAVTTTTPHTLRGLIDKSFITMRENSRYQIHELSRQYAADKLNSNDAEHARVQASHSDHYLSTLRKMEPNVRGRGQLVAFDEIEVDIENIRAAWQWALGEKDAGAIDGALDSLFIFFEARSRRQEGAVFFEMAHQQFASSSNIDHVAIRGRIAARLVFKRLHTVGDDETMESSIRHSLQSAQESENQREVAFCLDLLGQYLYIVHNDSTTSLGYLEQSLSIYRQLGDRHRCCFLLNNIISFHLADLEKAQEYGLEALSLAESIDDNVVPAYVQVNLSEHAIMLGDYAMAEAYCREASRLSIEMNLSFILCYTKIQLALLLFLKGEMEESEEHVVDASEAAKITNYGTTLLLLSATHSVNKAINGDYESARALGRASMENPLNDKFGSMLAHWALALAHIDLPNSEHAWEHVEFAVQLATERGATAILTWVLPIAAVLLNKDGSTERAVEHLALAYKHPLSPIGWIRKWTMLDELIAQWQDELGESRYQALWEQGELLTLETLTWRSQN